MCSYPRSADCVGSDRELESFPLRRNPLLALVQVLYPITTYAQVRIGQWAFKKSGTRYADKASAS